MYVFTSSFFSRNLNVKIAMSKYVIKYSMGSSYCISVVLTKTRGEGYFLQRRWLAFSQCGTPVLISSEFSEPELLKSVRWKLVSLSFQASTVLSYHSSQLTYPWSVVTFQQFLWLWQWEKAWAHSPFTGQPIPSLFPSLIGYTHSQGISCTYNLRTIQI